MRGGRGRRVNRWESEKGKEKWRWHKEDIRYYTDGIWGKKKNTTLRGKLNNKREEEIKKVFYFPFLLFYFYVLSIEIFSIYFSKKKKY